MSIYSHTVAYYSHDYWDMMLDSSHNTSEYILGIIGVHLTFAVCCSILLPEAFSIIF